MYSLGQGVKEDRVKGARWYRKAAEQGEANAQHALAGAYATGLGVPYNGAEAAKWYRKAAEQGERDDQSILGFLYMTGGGVPQDYVQAHMWFNLASAGGDPGSAESRDKLENRMTPTQIAKAQRLASEWRPKKNEPQRPWWRTPGASTAAGGKPEATISASDYGLVPIERFNPADYDLVPIGDATLAQSGDLIMAVQKRLADLGFDPGPADGVVSSKTRTAIRAFQRLMGTPVTGEASEELLNRLNREMKTAAARPLPIQQAPLVMPRTEPMIPADLDFGRYHALVIGNVAYRSLPKLETAVKDAEALAKLLRAGYGFEVILLKDTTRAVIIKALEGYRRGLGPKDNLLIYYAGHGWLDRDANRGYWLPVDAEKSTRVNWLSNADITDALKALKANHVMVIADSCYSGTLTRGDQRGLELVAKTPDYLTRIVKTKTRTALTSGGLEPVVDRGGGGHSVFAKALLDALRRNTGVVDGTQLFGRVREQVRLNAPQTPQYSNIRFAGHEVGGDFLFVRKR